MLLCRERIISATARIFGPSRCSKWANDPWHLTQRHGIGAILSTAPICLPRRIPRILGVEHRPMHVLGPVLLIVLLGTGRFSSRFLSSCRREPGPRGSRASGHVGDADDERRCAVPSVTISMFSNRYDVHRYAAWTSDVTSCSVH